MLRKRVITALWGIPLIIVVVWFDEPLPWFTVLAGIWGLLAALEFYRLTGVARSIPLVCFGMVWTLLFILRPHCTYDLIIPVLLGSGILLSLAMSAFLPPRENVYLRWSWLIIGIIYVGWLLSFLVALRLEAGRDWLFLALFATFGSDTAAYFIGKAFGRRKMAPGISPGKTWVGAVAGLFGAVIISLLFTLPKFFIWTNPVYIQELDWGRAIILGALISIFGQIGDLAESALKRYSGVKESGGLMPGHGGLLDRMDSVVLAGVVVYLYYIIAVA
ncbi:MAG: CDP-archaeol synthase [Dehalococcoidales bacterium]|nr:CDP-archaeol synthase [Dehalococcoidales bacterium]